MHLLKSISVLGLLGFLSINLNAEIKNIIFDMGGVLLDGGAGYIAHDAAQNSGAHDFEQIFKSEPWDRWMRGLITREEMVEDLSHLFERERVVLLTQKTLRPDRPFIQETVDWVKRLKTAGYRLYLLSNFSKESYEIFIKSNELFKEFDGIVCSFQVGCTKPGHEIYQILLDRDALIASECLFIDDLAENIEAGNRLGIAGIVYKKGSLAAELARYGILKETLITKDPFMHTRVGVGVMILKDGKILLGKRKGSHGEGKYAFPGGHLEHGESFADCAIRETLEEAGIEITNIQFQYIANLVHYMPKHYAHIGIICDWKSGEPQVLEPEKCESWAWYDLDCLPEPLFESIPLAIIAHKTGKTSFDVADCPTSESVYRLYEKFMNVVPL